MCTAMGLQAAPSLPPALALAVVLPSSPRLPLYVDSLVSLSPRGNEEPVWL